MQEYITIILLSLILIGILYLKVSLRQETDHQELVNQKLNQQNQNLMREMNQLKTSMEQQNKLIADELEQWKVERQALEASIQSTPKSNRHENLFLNERYREIFDLQKQGLTVEQIANKLEKGYGEVALILQLAVQERS